MWVLFVPCGPAYAKTHNHFCPMTAGLAELMTRGWWAHITMGNPSPWPEASSLPGPRTIPGAALNGMGFLTASGMSFLQDTRSLCCEPPSKMPPTACSTFLNTGSYDVTGSVGSSAQEAGPATLIIHQLWLLLCQDSSCSRDLGSAKPEMCHMYH